MNDRRTNRMNWNDRLIQLQKHWEKQPRLAWVLSALWLGLIVGIAFWLHLGSTGLLDETEPLFAEAARQMTVTGDWVTPYFNESTRFDKPPLIYWLMAFAYQTVGVNTWAARFPSALAATALTILGFFTLRYFGFSRPGKGSANHLAETKQPSSLWISAWIGSALIALNLQTIAWGRIGVSDMLLSGCMGCALLAFFWGYAQPNRPKAQSRWYFAFYCLSGLAVLAKGPVGIVLPGLIVIAFLLFMGNLRPVLREMRLLWGSLVFLAISVPWYVLVIWANGERYIESFFGYHNVERFTRVVNNHWAPIWFYFAVVPLAFVPWSIYLPVAIARLRFWQVQRWRQQPRSTHLGIFAAVWFALIFGFFTIAATKLPSYTIPLLPAAAILVGLFWSDQMTRHFDNDQPKSVQSNNSQADSRVDSRVVWFTHLANIAFALVLAVVVFYSPNWMTNEPEMPQLAELVRQSKMTLLGSIIWMIVAGVELLLLLKRQSRWIWSAQLIGFVAFLLVTLLPMMTLIDAQRQLPLRQLAATLVQVKQPEEPILAIGYRKPSLVFYTQQSIDYIAAPGDVEKQMKKYSRRLSRPRSGVHSLLIIGRPTKFREGGITPDEYETIADAGVYRLARINFSPN